jgi:hypothetical protein
MTPFARRAPRLKYRIDAEHDARNVFPIRTSGVCIQKTPIDDKVFLIVSGQHRFGRGNIGNGRFRPGRLHGLDYLHQRGGIAFIDQPNV